MTQMNVGECILNHYERYFGDPMLRHVFNMEQDIRSIQIFGYDKFSRDSIVLASFGLSKFEAELGEYAEVYCPVDKMQDEAATVLCNVLFHMVNTKMQLGPGISMPGIENVDQHFACKTGKHAMYLGSPYGVPKDFGLVSCLNKPCYIYTMVFISKNEHEYFVRHGSEALESLFDEKGVDPIDIMRPSCI
jgi:hypothetical protein